MQLQKNKRGFLRPKIESIYQNKNILNKLQNQKAL